MVNQAEITAADVTICEGTNAQLLAEGFAEDYEWMPSDDLSELRIPNPLADPTTTTTYTVVGKISTCEPDTTTATVTVIPAPDFRGPDMIYFFSGQSLTVNGGTPMQDGVYSYTWKPSAELSCDDCPNPEITPDTTMSLNVLYTDDITGCTSFRTIDLVELSYCPDDMITIPSAFSPDGDGINDELQLFNSSAIRGVTYFRVYNRWGAVVFETDDINEYWDGHYKGKLQPDGVYIYSLEYPCEVDGRIIRVQGDVTLIR